MHCAVHVVHVTLLCFDLPGAKEEFQKKFLMLYGGEDIDEKVEDKKFDKLMLNFDRI